MELCLGLIYHLNSQNYSIALIDDVDFTNAKVICTVFTAKHGELPLENYESSFEDTVALKSAPTDVGNLAHQLLLKVDDWASLDDGASLTAREALLIASLSELAKQNPDQRLLAAFLIHIGLLNDSSLGQRACQATSGLDSEASTFLTKVVHILHNLVKKSVNSDGAPFLAELNWDAFDLIDGMLFSSILDRPNEVTLGQTTAVRAAQLSQNLKNLSKVDCLPALKELLGRIPGEPSSKKVMMSVDAAQPVLKFTHPAFDQYFTDVKISTSSTEQRNTSSIFREATHWHNSHRTLSVKQVAKPLHWRVMKRHQRFMASTKKYADSLTSTPPEIVHLTSTTSLAAKPAWKEQLKQKSTAANKQGRGKNSRVAPVVAPKSAGLAIGEKAWLAEKKDLEKQADLQKRIDAATLYESQLDHGNQMGDEISLYICSLLLALFDKKAAAGQSSKLADAVALIWSRLAVLKAKSLSPKLSLELSKLIDAIQASTEKAKIQGVYQGSTSIEHQLEHYGPEMERGFDSAPDSRVAFKPDAWQRKVLDAIDEDKSICVIAPTSAGKTFISFYAMKKVMQSSDDDVLVYVAPTKALVNQIAAEVQGRFKKNFKHPESRSVWAIHTRDYRVNNPTGCQVLITVPHILQIMLLASPNAEKQNSWAHRIKRIIFDEVHCIGQEEEGVVWEQLLLLAPCPIIALSATVGNPGEFVSWLKESQKTKGHEMELVTHAARYSDLRKYIYKPSPISAGGDFTGFAPHISSSTDGLDGDGKSPFAFVHPIGSIVNRNRGTLDDISLEARDCLTLWRSMHKHQTAEFPVPDKLSPLHALPPMVKKAHILGWESDLKNCLLPWMMTPGSPFEAVRDELRSRILDTNGEDLQSPAENKQLKAENGETAADVEGETKTPKSNYFQLLLDLHHRRGLPAIIFNYDRDECETIMHSVIAELEGHESKWKKTSKEWLKTMSEYEKWKKSQEKSAKAPTTSKKSAVDEGFSKQDALREEATKDASKWEVFNPEDPLSRFSFADSRACPSEDLDRLLESLKWSKVDPIFINALKRGVGVHHAGMNRQYRQSVEILCRRGYLTVVIATGTLALGINVPCKTVVFSADSVFLSALNYHQASGRAGRRGFDLLGNVVFNLSTHRSLEIISSRLPSLRGQFPVSASLVLRTLSLCKDTNGSRYSIDAARSLLSQSLLYLGGPPGELSVKHHLRFSIEYLRSQQLLSQSGEPLNFAGLVSHLYFTENSAFAFHSLLKSGYLHNLCADINNNPNTVVLELLLVLSHVFCRQPCHQFQDKEWLERIKKSLSVVILPPLPPAALEILREHNRETLGIFKNYAQTYIRQHLADTPDDMLPFSGYRVGNGGQTRVDLSTSAPEIRSPFAALSGLDDSFDSIRDLCGTIRGGVFLEESVVPHVGVYPDDTDGTPWNAYLYDFFKHGDLKTLVESNGIKAGDVWFRLKDFSLILATIVTSLDNFLNPEAGYPDMTDVQDAFDKMADEEDDGEEEEYQIPGTEVQQPKENAASKKTVKKPKVADSWDDGEESSEPEDDSEDESDGELEGEIEGKNDRANLMNILKAFKILQKDFDTKFKEVWA